MASQLDFHPPSNIEFSHLGGDIVSSQHYCGVCHGLLKVKDLTSNTDDRPNDDDDEILRTTSSSESFPLPSSASAVGKVHPCGHLFHVSCFHNHNNKLLKKGKHKGNPMVEILEAGDGASCVEVTSSDEFEESFTHEEDFNECPTCRKRSFLFVELSSAAVMQNLHHPLRDAVDKMAVELNETDDDAESDIMNYYSFANSAAEGGENLFVDTTNIMSHSLMSLANNNVNAKVKHSHSDASTEYHDVQSTISHKLVSSALTEYDTTQDSEPSENAKVSTSIDKASNVVNGKSRTASSRKLLYFDSRSTPVTPGIMITPGTMQRRKVNKKVRFFDDLSNALLKAQSLSREEGEKPALLDQVGSDEEDPDDSDIVEITSEDVNDENFFEEQTDMSGGPDDNGTRIPLSGSPTEDSHDNDEMLGLANVLVLPSPSTDSKSLLWNVSTYEEEDENENRSKGGAFVDKLQEEIDGLRSQLIQSEQEKEETRRVMGISRTRELGAVAHQAKEIARLKRDIIRLTKQKAVNHQEIMTAEEELATAQIQLETAVDDHQLSQSKLLVEKEKAEEELEEVKYQLEICQQELHAGTEAAMANKEALMANQAVQEAELKQQYDKKVESMQEKIDQAEMELQESNAQLESCKQEIQDRLKGAEEEKEALIADNDRRQKERDMHMNNLKQELADACSELEATKTKLSSCEEEILQHEKKVSEENDSLKTKHMEIQMRQEHEATVEELQNTLEKIKLELESARNQMSEIQAEAQKKVKTAVISNAALVARHKATVNDLNADYDAKRAEAHVKLEQQIISLQGLESLIKERELQFKTAAAEMEAAFQRERQSKEELQVKLEKNLPEGCAAQIDQLRVSRNQLMSDLEKQQQLNNDLNTQLHQTQQQVKIAAAELAESRSINFEESEEMNIVREELDATRTDMETLIANMQESEKEMVLLRKELNAAKEALAATTNDMDLQRMSTSSSSLSPRHSADDGICVQSLQEELQAVKQELAAKNQFIQGQLTLAKGKLIDFVRTKEGDLEHTKKELAKTKQLLKDKDVSFARQLQETESELQELSSMRETLLTTMNELAEKNSIITSHLLDSQAELVFLAETNQRLQEVNNQKSGEGETRHAQVLSVPDLKLGNAFAVAAVFMGHWLSECAKAKFNLKSQPKHEQADPIPDMNDVEVS